jgi:hypothetical protein
MDGSTAEASGAARSGASPTACAAANTSAGRRRFPPE